MCPVLPALVYEAVPHSIHHSLIVPVQAFFSLSTAENRKMIGKTAQDKAIKQRRAVPICFDICIPFKAGQHPLPCPYVSINTFGYISTNIIIAHQGGLFNQKSCLLRLLDLNHAE